jgi:hypothetical protein
MLGINLKIQLTHAGMPDKQTVPPALVRNNPVVEVELNPQSRLQESQTREKYLAKYLTPFCGA